MKKIYLILFYLCLSSTVFGFSNLGNAGGNVAAATFCVAATDHIVYQFSIAQSPGPTTNLNTVNFTTAGTYVAADVTNFKLWRNTVNNFATATVIGTPLGSLGPGAHAYNAGGGALTGGTTYYFWITATFPVTAIAVQTLSVNGTPSLSIINSGGGSGGATTAGGVQTINNVPTAVTATATPNPVCLGSNLTLTGVATGATSYAWAGPTAYAAAVQNPPAFATTAGSAGIYTFTATNACGSTTANTASVTVNPLPSPITGGMTICIGTTSSLSDASGAGTWTSSTPGVATVNAAGVVTGVAAGTSTIIFTSGATGCTASAIVTVSTSLPAITGSLTLCQYTNTTLSDPFAGGTWSTSGTSIATVNPITGIVNGIAPGMDTVTYSSSGCTATSIVTVNPVPAPGAVTGTSTICVGTTTPLADTPAGGVWVSGDPLIATIDVAGNVTGVSAGMAVITYNLTNACGTTGATFLMTIERPASAITGLGIVCIGNSISLSDSSWGGTWSASNGFATISTVGVVTGVAAGIDTITYNISNSCGTSSATTYITIGVPAPIGVISGPSDVCVGSHISLSESVSGGVWAVSNGFAAISTTGLVTGLSNGVDTVMYLVTAECGVTFATHVINVDSFGTPYVSISANPGTTSCATVPVTYTANPTNGGSAPTYIWKVNGTFVGVGSTFTYVPTTGDVISCTMASNYPCALATGASNFVTATVIPRIIPTMNIVAGTLGDTVCIGTIDTFFANFTNAGLTPSFQWTVNSTAIGTGSSLVYTPNNGDTIACTYVSTAICAIPDTIKQFVVMTVDATEVPTVSVTIDPADTVCSLTDVSFTAHGTYGGRYPEVIWIKNGVNVGTGLTYHYVPNNLDTISCEFISSSPCATPISIFSNKIIMHVVAIVAPSLTLSASTPGLVHYGHADTFTAVVSGAGFAPNYQWTVNNVLVYGATSSTFVLNNVTRKDTVSCIVTEGHGNCPAAEANGYIVVDIIPSGIVELNNANSDFNIVPNPNNGLFTVLGSYPDESELTLQITDVVGRIVTSDKTNAINGHVNKQINLHPNLANGVYLLHIISKEENKVIRFTIER